MSDTPTTDKAAMPDLTWAERVVEIIDREATLDADERVPGHNYDRAGISTARMRSLCRTIIDQAEKIERLAPTSDDELAQRGITTALAIQDSQVTEMMGGPIMIHPAKVRELVDTVLALAVAQERFTPRVLDAVEEIDALPSLTVIRDKWGQVHERSGSHWCMIQNEDVFYETVDLGSPVTVIFIPKEGEL